MVGVHWGCLGAGIAGNGLFFGGCVLFYGFMGLVNDEIRNTAGNPSKCKMEGHIFLYWWKLMWTRFEIENSQNGGDEWLEKGGVGVVAFVTYL